MCFVKYFQNFYENRRNSNATVFFNDAGCIHFCNLHGVDASDARWFQLPTSMKMLGKKKTCAID